MTLFWLVGHIRISRHYALYTDLFSEIITPEFMWLIHLTIECTFLKNMQWLCFWFGGHIRISRHYALYTMTYLQKFLHQSLCELWFIHYPVSSHLNNSKLPFWYANSQALAPIFHSLSGYCRWIFFAMM